MPDQREGMLNPSRIMGGLAPGPFRLAIQLVPPVRNSGVRIEHISSDWRHWRLRLPLSLKTRNYVGTHFGGTLYSAADPHFMLAWMQILGPSFTVWDKAATIRFRRPGRGTLRAEFAIPEQDIEDIRALQPGERAERTYHLAWVDGEGTTVAEVEKVLHFRREP